MFLVEQPDKEQQEKQLEQEDPSTLRTLYLKKLEWESEMKVC